MPRARPLALLVLLMPGIASVAQAPPPETRLDLRVDPLIDLYFGVRAQAAREGEPAREGFEAAVTAARRIQEEMGSWGGWGPIDARVFAARRAAELEPSFAELEEPMTRRGREISVRGDALALAAALAELEPRFVESAWPERRDAIAARLADLEERFLPRHGEALAYMMSSLGIADPKISVPFYLVTEINPPGASTYYVADGSPVAVLGLEWAGEGEHLFETLLHEATHSLDIASEGGGSAFATLRELLAERGLTRRDPLYHDIPHTLMFVQAAATTRRFYDADHRDYGDVSGAYERSSGVAAFMRPIWRRYLAGEIGLEPALREIVAAAPLAGDAP